jgi:hypothetical protein
MPAHTRSPRPDGVRVAAAAAVAVLAALILAGGAAAAYTKPALKAGYSGATTVIVVTADADEDATAAVVVYAPAGTTLALDQAPGSTIGTASAMVRAMFLGGALFPLQGEITVAAPGAVPAAQQSGCAQGQPVATTWLLTLRAAGQTLTIPVYVSPTAGAETALGPAKLIVCFPASDLQPSTLCRPTLCAKLVSATLSVAGVFSRVTTGAWLAVWTPYAPGTGLPNASGRVASPLAIAPGQVTLLVAKRGRVGSRLKGTLTQGGQPTAGTVTILAGPTASRLAVVATVRAGAKGTFSYTYGKKALFFRARGSAGARPAEPLCAALTGLPAPCVNPLVNGFSVRSGIARRPA